MASKKAPAPKAAVPEADAATPAPGGGEENTGAEGEAKAGGKKKKLIIIIAVMLLLALAGGGGAWFMLGGGHDKDKAEDGAPPKAETATAEDAAEEGEEGGEPALVDVPAMIINLRTASGETKYLKLRFMLEARKKEQVEPLKAKLPAILDAFQPFLRELRPEDLAGAAAVYRIKEEMLVRATSAVGPGIIKDVLIQDLVQQ